ncbi:TPA: Ivy family c-type lysozyme inhibitor [Neisseria bacilliformis]
MPAMPRLARIAAVLALMLAVSAPAAAKSVEIEWMADRHLSELLKKTAYRQVWRSQILSEIPAEDQVWIEDALSSSGPHGEIRINGQRYLASTLRHPRDDNKLYILINEQRAVAAHAQFHEADRMPAHNESGKRTEAFTLRYYGRPDQAEKEALRELMFQEWKAEAEENARQKPDTKNE